MKKRLNSLGTSDVLVQPMGESRIIIQVPGITEEKRRQYRNTLQRVAKLEFKLVHPQNELVAPSDQKRVRKKFLLII